jgi:hypothetical protein
MDIQQPLFTLAQLCRVTGLERGVANMWLRRGQIHASRSERLPIRKRAFFSVFAIFRVKLMHVVAEHLTTMPSESTDFTQQIEKAMWTVSREFDRGRTLDLLAAVTKDGDCWRVIFPELDARKFTGKLGPDMPFAVIPAGRIFAAVYRECKRIYDGESLEQPKKARRARS